jgi:hypothetical protein
MTTGKGSGLFAKQEPLFPHIVQGNTGLGGEIADLRRALLAVLSPLIATTIEEYDAPQPALPTSVMAVTASSLTLVSYTHQTGVSSAAIVPPRNIEVVVAGTTPAHMGASVLITGLDAQGKLLTETITGTSGGAGTYVGIKCFSQVLSVAPAAGTGTDATFSVGTGIVIGLSQTPKLRAGQTTPLIKHEIVDAAVVTTGTLATTTAHPPYGAYVPATAPTTPAAASVTGSANITSAGLYGPSGTLAGGGTGLTLILNVNGAGALTLTFDGTGGTNAASEAAMLAAIEAEWPALLATQTAGDFLELTTIGVGAIYSIVIGAGTATTALGLTEPATYDGTGHSYAYEYEFDASLLASVK